MDSNKKFQSHNKSSSFTFQPLDFNYTSLPSYYTWSSTSTTTKTEPVVSFDEFKKLKRRVAQVERKMRRLMKSQHTHEYE